MVKISSVMKREVITVDPKLTVSDAAKIMTNNRVGSLVIVKGRRPIGIITESDIVGLVARGGSPTKIRLDDLPEKKQFVIALPDEAVTEVTKRMIKTGVKRVPVIKDGKLMGIVSDKEILLVAPELLTVLSEKLKMRVESVARPDQVISGICEQCGQYSDNLRHTAGGWFCEECTED
jgi:CBS domain-containing protein